MGRRKGLSMASIITAVSSLENVLLPFQLLSKLFDFAIF